ncbi:MAG: hypothetical protein IT379_41265 [Deltaproteobacteria bacterium]|nr:hypothetical protein [Deltaproteobacteria bacterium]
MSRSSIRLAAAVLVSLVVSFSFVACGSSSDPPAGSGHASSSAQPGTYEDWCDEHGVPESQCTRCNAALIPAFKATHDWCDEHGLPESQCRACNPNLQIARPAKRAGGR